MIKDLISAFSSSGVSASSHSAMPGTAQRLRNRATIAVDTMPYGSSGFQPTGKMMLAMAALKISPSLSTVSVTQEGKSSPFVFQTFALLILLRFF